MPGQGHCGGTPLRGGLSGGCPATPGEQGVGAPTGGAGVGEYGEGAGWYHVAPEPAFLCPLCIEFFGFSFWGVRRLERTSASSKRGAACGLARGLSLGVIRCICTPISQPLRKGVPIMRMMRPLAGATAAIPPVVPSAATTDCQPPPPLPSPPCRRCPGDGDSGARRASPPEPSTHPPHRPFSTPTAGAAASTGTTYSQPQRRQSGARAQRPRRRCTVAAAERSGRLSQDARQKRVPTLVTATSGVKRTLLVRDHGPRPPSLPPLPPPLPPAVKATPPARAPAGKAAPRRGGGTTIPLHPPSA